MEKQIDAFWNSLQTFLDQLAGFLPQLIAALLILIIGWIIARIIRRLIIKGLTLVKFDVLTEKSGIDKLFKEGGIPLTFSDLLGNLVYWMLLLIILLAAINSLGLVVTSELLNEIILHIPNVIVATIILLVGAFLARFFEGLALVYLRSIGVKAAETISRIVQYAILVFVISLALNQMGIAQEFVTSAFQIAFGAVCLALALAFGLGAKTGPARWLRRHLNARKVRRSCGV